MNKFVVRALALIAVVTQGWVAMAPSSASAGVYNPKTFWLDNGMQVVVLPNHRAPIVLHMVWYKSGSADDPVGKSGIAHLLEHLMFKGTPKHPNGEFRKLWPSMAAKKMRLPPTTIPAISKPLPVTVWKW